jgi:cobalt transporter subunit CbtA
MFRRLVMAAVAAGLTAGVAVSAVQRVTTVPLILVAEGYEAAAPAVAPGHDHGHGAGAVAGHQATQTIQATQPQHPEAVSELAAEIADPRRTALTVLTNVVVGSGYALLLAGAMLLAGVPVDARRGLLWGAGGFAAFVLAPAAGLPPELPGTAAAELVARQGWWLAAAGGAALGVLALGLSRRPLVVVVALAVAIVPHIVGAPQGDGASSAPAELAVRFAVQSIAVAAVFWAILGAACGAMMRRVVDDAAQS